jgi:hypothetical protein
MTIDQVTINLYTCCKCGRKWTNWDSENIREGPLPLNCPRCRNVRWNQAYTKEDLILVKRLERQHMIKQNEIRKLPLIHAVGIPDPKRYILEKRSYIDFIAYYFLYLIRPQPEIFEIKQVLGIPKDKMEQRHNLMLSIVHNRINNREKYRREHYSKYGPYSNRDRFISSPDYAPDYGYKPKNYSILVGRRMKGCKHKQVEPPPKDYKTDLDFMKSKSWELAALLPTTRTHSYLTV